MSFAEVAEANIEAIEKALVGLCNQTEGKRPVGSGQYIAPGVTLTRYAGGGVQLLIHHGDTQFPVAGMLTQSHINDKYGYAVECRSYRGWSIRPFLISRGWRAVDRYCVQPPTSFCKTCPNFLRCTLTGDTLFDF